MSTIDTTFGSVALLAIYAEQAVSPWVPPNTYQCLQKPSKPWKPEQNFKILFAPAVLQVWTKRFENFVILFDFPETKAKIYHRTPLYLQKTLFLSAKMLFW